MHVKVVWDEPALKRRVPIPWLQITPGLLSPGLVLQHLEMLGSRIQYTFLLNKEEDHCTHDTDRQAQGIAPPQVSAFDALAITLHQLPVQRRAKSPCLGDSLGATRGPIPCLHPPRWQRDVLLAWPDPHTACKIWHSLPKPPSFSPWAPGTVGRAVVPGEVFLRPSDFY